MKAALKYVLNIKPTWNLEISLVVAKANRTLGFFYHHLLVLILVYSKKKQIHVCFFLS